MKKRLTALIVVFSMIFCVGTSIGYAAKNDNFDFEYETEVLSQIGVLSGVDLNGYRATDYMVMDDYMRIIKNIVIGYDAEYELNTFSKMYGFTKETTTLLKSSHVTYEFATKTALKLIGYSSIAEAIDDKDYTYLTNKNRSGLSKGLSDLKDAQSLRVDKALKLIYNMLNEELIDMQTAGSGKDGYTYTYVKTDETVMNRYLGIYDYDGILTSTQYTAMYGDSTLGEDEVGVGSYILKNKSEKELDDLVGTSVTAFYKNADRVNTLVAAIPDKSNDTLVVDAEDIIGFNETTRTLSYYNTKGKKKNAVLDKTAAVIYNNRGLSGYTKDDFEICDGYITLTKNYGSGNYNVANIKEYIYVLADGVHSSGGEISITNKITFDGYQKITSNKEDYFVIKDENGVEVETSSISNGALIKVIYNKDAAEKKIEAVVSYDFIEAVPQRISGDMKTVTLNGKKYDFTEYYKKASGEGEKYMPVLDFNTRYVFYLTTDGKIAAAKSSGKDDFSYGYMKTAVTVNEGLYNTCKVKVFTENGKWEIYTLNEKVIYGTAGRLNSVDVLNNYLGVDDSTNSQMIGYKLDSVGNICEICTAVDESTTDDENVFTKSATSKLTYRNGTVNSFGAQYFAESGANVFMIPDDGIEEHFSLTPVTGLIATYQYNVCGYNGDKFKCYDFFSIKVDYDTYAKDLATRGTFFVINEVQKTINSEGSDVTRIFGITGFMTTFSMDLIDELDGSGLKCGDVIKFGKDSEGNINYFDKVFDIDLKGCPTENTTIDTLYRSLSGIVTEIDYENYRIKVQNGTNTNYVYSDSAGKFIVYEGGGKKPMTRTGNILDIEKGDIVFSSTNYGYSGNVYVVKQ